MIEDREMLAIFKAESEEYLQTLDRGLLQLEGDPQARATLDALFRAAHNLKGTAGMLGLVGVQEVAHRFEDVLGQARRDPAALTTDTVERLYGGVDALRQLVHASITGSPAAVSVEEVLERLGRGVNDGSMEALAPEPTTIACEPSAPAGRRPEPAPASVEAPVFEIETLRVSPRRLDALMTLAGELTVTKTRLARRQPQIEEIIALWDDWEKDSYANRTHLMALERGASEGSVKRIADFHERERERLDRLGAMLKTLLAAVSEDNARLDAVATELEQGIHTVRLLPLSTVFGLFPRTVRDLAQAQGKQVRLSIEGGETSADKRILEGIKDPLMHMIRNAVDHGIEPPALRVARGKPEQATILLSARQTPTNIIVEVSDDGSGLDTEAIKRTALKRKLHTAEELRAMTPDQIKDLVFTRGFSTSTVITDVSGRGVGMDVVRANVERLKGTLQVDSTSGQGSTFRMVLPITLATARVLLAAAAGRTLAIPVEYVDTTFLLAAREIFTIEGRETVVRNGAPLSVARLSDLLGLLAAEATPAALPWRDGRSPEPGRTRFPCIVVNAGRERMGLVVDDVLDEQEVVMRPLGGLLRRVRYIAGATILSTGDVCTVLNPHDLLAGAWKRAVTTAPRAAAASAEEERKRVILLVEDSLMTRTQEKRILETGGYEVITAVDGADGLAKLETRPFDLVVSDIQMPNIDGLEMTARIRQDKRYTELPIILVTWLASEDDRRRGLEAGANAYIAKPGFDQRLLLEAVQRLI